MIQGVYESSFYSSTGILPVSLTAILAVIQVSHQGPDAPGFPRRHGRDARTRFSTRSQTRDRFIA